jgi:hypothetical protein
MREFAPDKDSFDDFVKQWFFQVVVPQYELADATKVHIVGGSDGGPEDEWEIRVKVKNAGTGSMPVEIAATRGERFPDEKTSDSKTAKEKAAESSSETASESVVQAADLSPNPSAAAADAKADKAYREARTTITLGAGESQDVVLRCPFEPSTIVVDPDAVVLQLERKFAIFRF